VRDVLRSAISLQLAFSLLTFLFFFINTKLTISILFPGEFSEKGLFSDGNLSLFKTLWFCLMCSFLYISFEGIRWVFSGILTAAGDTVFLLIAGSLSVWGLLILPIYLVVVRNQLSVTTAWAICVLYSILTCFIYGWRYRKGKWKEINLLGTYSEEI